MMRRWLKWVPVAIVLFAVSMNMAHIGSEWLWTAVIVVAAASTLVLRREPQGAGRR